MIFTFRVDQLVIIIFDIILSISTVIYKDDNYVIMFTTVLCFQFQNDLYQFQYCHYITH